MTREADFLSKNNHSAILEMKKRNAKGVSQPLVSEFEKRLAHCGRALDKSGV
jgi:hypothetical protein